MNLITLLKKCLNAFYGFIDGLLQRYAEEHKKQKYKIEKYLTEIFGSRSRGLFRKFGVRF